jgi:hypothetical protein
MEYLTGRLDRAFLCFTLGGSTVRPQWPEVVDIFLGLTMNERRIGCTLRMMRILWRWRVRARNSTRPSGRFRMI